MADLTRRMMDAHANANDDATARQLNQSSAQQVERARNQANGDAGESAQPSAYDILFSETPAPNALLEQTSAVAIRESLLRRAKAKQMGIDEKLKFNNSKLANGSYRAEAFNSSDDEGRKSVLGTADTKKVRERTREKEKREHLTTKDRKQRFNATGDAGKSDTGARGGRQSFNAGGGGSFSKPVSGGYNPYA